MRFSSKKKDPSTRTREERLREGRASAPTLRASSPSAKLIEVRLKFLPETAPLHAAQAFVLYPAARAFFEYPCPYGDCDGTYDLGAQAENTFKRDKSSASGTLECGGTRSRDGLQRQPCGLRVHYTITAHHEPDPPR
jgi:hypothetical protein